MCALQMHRSREGTAVRKPLRRRRWSRQGLAIWLLAAAALVAVMAGGAAANSTTVTTNPASATVAGSSTVPMSFALERTGDLAYDTWLSYETRDGTAMADADYVGTSGSVLLPAGATDASIPIEILGASGYSPDKQFRLEVRAAGVGPTPVFADRQTFPAGKDARFAPADVNGDGRTDLVAANDDAETFSVLLNTTAAGASMPSFAAQQVFAGGRGPMSPTMADLNGDGKPDLILANLQFDERAVSVFLNTTETGSATASFAAREVVGEGEAPFLLTAADLNGDGRSDLIYSHLDRDFVSVQLNTTEPGAATPSFAAAQDFATEENANSVKATDVNGDGRRDLVVSTGVGESISVLLNTTAAGAAIPSFTPHRSFPVGINPRGVATGDLNGDGRPDLVAANLGTPGVSVLLNTTATGAMTPSFAPESTITILPTALNQAVTVADLNGDGKPELIVTPMNGLVSVLLNTTAPGATTPSFSVLPRLATGLVPAPIGGWAGTAVADLNGDGRPDLIVPNRVADEAAVIFLNTTVPGAATPSFAAAQDFTTGDAPSAIASADVNGDGRADLLVANEGDDQASVLLNTTVPGAATPSFAAAQDFATGDAPSAIASADVNGDGRADLLVANEGDDQASVLLNTTVPGAATPSFAAAQDFTTGDAPSAIASADVNGDGRADLLVANEGDDQVSVLLNTTVPGAATPSFAAAQDFATGDAPSAIASADVNGDGRADLLVANEGDDQASVLLNTTVPGAATPSFAAAQDFTTGDAPSAIASADVNGDGRADLLVANEGDDQASVLLNTTVPGAATPSFAAAQNFTTGDAPSAIASADVNGDGRADLLVANEGDDQVSVLLNTTVPGAATPSFAAAQDFTTGDAPSAIASADVNGDGTQDILAANRGANDVSALLGTQYAASAIPASVTGTIAYAIPRVSLGPGPLAFGEQLVGSGVSRTATLSNTGGDALTVKGIAITGPDAAQFTHASSCPPALAVGSSCPITVTFRPNAAAAAGAALTVTSDAPTGSDAVALSGMGYRTTPPPLPPPTTDPPDTDKTPVPPRLRIGRVSAKPAASSRLRLAVAGKIATEARGTVIVKASTRLNGRRVTATGRARILDGRWRTRLALPGADRTAIYVTARYEGAPGIDQGHVKHRVPVIALSAGRG